MTNAYTEAIDEILWELTDQSGWDLIGITQDQANQLSKQLEVERQKAKATINQAVKEHVISEDDWADSEHDELRNRKHRIRNNMRAEQRNIVDGGEV